MNQLHSKDILKILPFEEEFSLSLLAKWDTLSLDQRYDLERVIWDLYEAIYTIKLNEKIALAMEDIERKDKMDENFYKRLKQEVENELLDSNATAATSIDLSSARKKLEELTQAS